MRSTKEPKRVVYLISILFLTACAEVLEKSLHDKTILVTAPVNNLISSDSIQTFYWEKLSDATSYQLQIVSPRFDSIATFIIDTSVQNNLFPFHLSSGNYQWRVRGNNQNSSTSFSDPRDLFIK
jgi:hypothetical protein